MEGGGCLMADGGWRMEDELWIKDGWITDDAYYKGVCDLPKMAAPDW